MDRVFIEQLKVSSTIGVYDWEKSIKQDLYFDLEMAFDNKPAAKDDNIELALDYFKVSEEVTLYAQANQFELLETMAENVASLIMNKFNVSWIRLKLHKPDAIQNVKSLGVEIVRSLN